MLLWGSGRLQTGEGSLAGSSSWDKPSHSQAAIASPGQPAADSPIDQMLPFYISLPKALQQVETQPQRVLI